MGSEASVRQNADALELRLDAAQRELARADVPEGRAGALNEMLRYVALLRDAAVDTLTNYTFKLELPDGRWDVAEQPLPAAPRVGDQVRLADGRWKVLGTEWVRPRPSGKPPRAFFVCAPAT